MGARVAAGGGETGAGEDGGLAALPGDRIAPLHLQVRQTSDVASCVAVPVRALSARKYIRTSLNTLEREAKSFCNASASLITA